MMTEYEKWHFDLMGYVVLKNAIPRDDVQRIVELANTWHALPDSQLPKPLKNYGGVYTDWTKTRSINHVEYVDPVFQRALLNLEVMRVVLALTGNCPQVLLSALQIYPTNAGDGPLHNGFDGGLQNPANQYEARNGKILATFLNVGVALVDHPQGEGFCCIPGSHKSNFPWPDSITTRSEPPLLITPQLHAGDVLVFTELLRHGGRNWTQPTPRMMLFTRYGTSYASWAVGYKSIPEYAHQLTPELVELMEPASFQARKAVVKRLLAELGEA